MKRSHHREDHDARSVRDGTPPFDGVLAGNGTASDYFALLKPRVMSLVVFTAFAGLLVAPEPMHPWMGFMTLLAIALGAGASGALNMWFDVDIDALMKRTAQGPCRAAPFSLGEALGFGVTLAVASVLTLGLVANYLAAAILAFTIFFYVVVYTMWLKRWTAQNIVIGGAAGAFPPVIASTAATGAIDLPALSLFLIIFLWTPPHFWALALLRADDYARAEGPHAAGHRGRGGDPPSDPDLQRAPGSILPRSASPGDRGMDLSHRFLGTWRPVPRASLADLSASARRARSQICGLAVRLLDPLPLRPLRSTRGGAIVRAFCLPFADRIVMAQDPPIRELTREELAVRRRRSIVLALILAAFVVLFFITTMVRLGGNVAERAL